jgi:hypothetical protein
MTCDCWVKALMEISAVFAPSIGRNNILANQGLLNSGSFPLIFRSGTRMCSCVRMVDCSPLRAQAVQMKVGVVHPSL